MTKAEAIKIIENYEVYGCGYCHTGGNEVPEAFDMAVKALKEESDKINRQSVLNLLRVMKDEFNSVPEAYQTLGDAIMRMDE